MLDRSCKACSMRVDRNRLMCSLFRGSVDGLHRLTREGVMLSVLRSSTSRLLRSCNAVCRINHPMLRHYHESRYQRIFQYLVESGEERFSASGVARSYAWDRLDAKQWLLIYRDSNASRTYALAAILFPTASIVAFILFIDFFKNGPRNRTAFVQKLCKDATELGALAAFPIVCFFIVIFGLARVQNLRLFRIYQNIENPYRFIAIVPRSGVLQRKMQFDRSSAVLIADSDGIESQSLNLWRMFVSGSLLLNERRFVHDDDCFRANNFRSFMLSETDTLPREVALKHRS